jgi:hypothetical protein
MTNLHASSLRRLAYYEILKFNYRLWFMYLPSRDCAQEFDGLD